MTGTKLVGDRGSESVELAILLPVAFALIATLVVGARVSLAADRISGVAGIAARDASLARSPELAKARATDAARAALSAQDLHCTDVRVTVDTSGFAVSAGTPAFVIVDVWCSIPLSEIGIAGLPGVRTLHDRGVSGLDPARDV